MYTIVYAHSTPAPTLDTNIKTSTEHIQHKELHSVINIRNPVCLTDFTS